MRKSPSARSSGAPRRRRRDASTSPRMTHRRSAQKTPHEIQEIHSCQSPRAVLRRKLLLVTIGDHAGDELIAEGRDAGELEGRHALPELVGLAGREAGADNGDAHGLL